MVLQPTSPTANLMELGNVVLNLQNFQVTVAQKDVDLSYQEFELVRLLMSEADKVLSHDEITLALYHACGHLYTRRLAVLVHRVRTKLARSQPYFVKGVRGRGYGMLAGRPPRGRGATMPEG